MLSRALVAIVGLFAAIILAEFFEGGDFFDPARGRRHCGAPPQEIRKWSYTDGTRRSEDRTGLEQWLQKHPEQVNQLFGAFCHSALHTAARFGRDDLALILITRGANVNVGADPNGETPLHLAAQYGRASVAVVLVSRSADVNAATKYGRTPLHDAAFGLAGTSDLDGRVAVAELLISRGANVNARESGSGRTALDQITGTANQEKMATLLIRAGAHSSPGL